MMKIRDRVIGLERVRATDLIPNEKNWRVHGRKQRAAMRRALEEIGYAGALLARRREDGKLALIDGHLRAETSPDMEVPVLVLDVTEKEAMKLLATYDPISAMAEQDDEALRAVVEAAELEADELVALVDGLLEDDDPERLKIVPVLSPPERTWVLIGIETVRFSEIAAHVEKIGQVGGILLETTVTSEDR